MAGFTYLFAGWSMRVLVERRWREWPLMLLATWWCIDGCYALYWSLVDPNALAMMREANWPASLSLYWMCGLLALPGAVLDRWYHDRASSYDRGVGVCVPES